nr:MAG TPA: hypothetical protein [Caudoviricetes sp.]DAT68670.1 MAG TPA: hypothetical protein [Caudoviricetes sp.]
MDVLETLDSLQSAVEEDKKKEQKKSKQEYHFDKLKMYFGEDYTINGITISIPTIGDILEIGEARFYQAVSPFLNNPTSIRVLLYDVFKMDWNKTKDIEVFYIMLQMVKDKEPLKLLFKNISFEDFKLINAKKNEFEKDYKWLALVSPSQNILIYEDQYLEIAEFIRDMLNVHPKTEKAKGKTTKHWMLQEDRMKAEQNQNEENKSTLLPLVSACVNHPGFKYKLEELKQVNICQFMDSVQRIQKYEQGVAAMHGIYGGFVNAKDIPQDLINFMSDL